MRKMGHATLLGEHPDEILKQVEELASGWLAK
jgi:phosphoribosylaminoimidazole carboxylase (NCAIR synthetase)